MPSTAPPLRTPSVFEPNRFPSLDGFRAVSITIVIASHILLESNSRIPKLLPGVYGVTIFFAISGILITTLLLKEKVSTGTISLGNFYLRRFLRIFPVAYLFLLTLSILNLVFHLNISWQSFVSSALYIRNTNLLETGDWQTAHFWSLALEEQFYLLFPFLLTVLPARVYALVVIILTGIIPGLDYWVSHYAVGEPFILLNDILARMPPILIGSLTSVLMFMYGSPSFLFRIRLRGLVTISLFVVAALIAADFFPFIPAAVQSVVVSLCVVSFLVLNLVHDSNIIFRFLNNRYVIYIGVLSYSLYVWQQLFFPYVLWKTLGHTLLNLILLLAVSYVSYNFYERRFLAIKDRIKRTSK